MKFAIFGNKHQIKKSKSIEQLFNAISKHGDTFAIDRPFHDFLQNEGLQLPKPEELIEEGFVYEVISKIQTMRKDSGFEVMDHITVYVSENEKIANIIKANETAISEKVLADEIRYNEACENAKKWNINGEDVSVGVVRK